MVLVSETSTECDHKIYGEVLAQFYSVAIIFCDFTKGKFLYERSQIKQSIGDMQRNQAKLMKENGQT